MCLGELTPVVGTVVIPAGKDGDCHIGARLPLNPPERRYADGVVVMIHITPDFHIYFAGISPLAPEQLPCQTVSVVIKMIVGKSAAGLADHYAIAIVGTGSGVKMDVVIFIGMDVIMGAE